MSISKSAYSHYITRRNAHQSKRRQERVDFQQLLRMRLWDKRHDAGRCAVTVWRQTANRAAYPKSTLPSECRKSSPVAIFSAGNTPFAYSPAARRAANGVRNVLLCKASEPTAHVAGFGTGAGGLRPSDISHGFIDKLTVRQRRAFPTPWHKGRFGLMRQSFLAKQMIRPASSKPTFR